MRNLLTAINDFDEVLPRMDSLQRRVTQMGMPHTDAEARSFGNRAMQFSGMPTFTRNTHGIRIVDKTTFDYSVLAEAIASYCIGLDQFMVATDLQKLQHQVFETMALYSSSYHFLDALLSIRGVHFVPNPLTTPRSYETRMKIYGRRADTIQSEKRRLDLPCVMGETTGSSRWTFTRSDLSHTIRWRKFAELLIQLIDSKQSSEIPIGVKNFYGYLKAIEDYKRHRYEWLEFRINIPNDGALKSAVATYSKEIPEVRHQAVYQNRSYDVFAYAAGVNKQDVRKFVEIRLNFIREFSIAMAKWATEELNLVFQNLRGLKPGPTQAVDWVHFACEYIPCR